MKDADTRTAPQPGPTPAPRPAMAPAPVASRASDGRGLPLWVILVTAAGVLRFGLGGDGDVAAVEAARAGERSRTATAVANQRPPGRYVPGGDVALEPGPLDELAGAGDAPLESSRHERAAEREALARPLTPPGGDGPVGLHPEPLRGGAGHWPGLEGAGREAGAGSPDAARPARRGDGVVDGPWELHDGAGQLLERGSFLGGKRHGAWMTYGADGAELERIHYLHGLREGDWRAFAPSGEVIGQGRFEANLRQGEWVLHYTSGGIRERGTYVNGLREGLWEFYDDLGRPTPRSGNYLAGAKID